MAIPALASTSSKYFSLALGEMLTRMFLGLV